MKDAYVLKIINGAFYTLLAFLPIFFVPLALNLGLGRDIIFGLISFFISAGIIFVFLKRGSVQHVVSAPLYTAGVFVLINLLSSFFSKQSYISFLYSDVSAEKSITILIGFLLMVMLPFLVKEKDTFADSALTTLFSAGSVASILLLLQLLLGFSVFGAIFSLARLVDINAVGTVNGFSVLIAALLLAVLSKIVFTTHYHNKKSKFLDFGFLVVFLLTVAVIHFPVVLLVLIISFIFLYVLYTIHQKNQLASRSQSEIYTNQTKLFAIFISLIIVLLAYSNFLPKSKYSPSVEISPSAKITWNIGIQSVKGGFRNAIIGRGPGSFGESWSLYRDESINTTNFWSVRFNQGSSLIVSSLATTGILGSLSLLVFTLLSLIILSTHIVRLVKANTVTPVQMAYFSLFVVTSISFVFYSTIVAVMYLFFISLGILTALLATNYIDHPHTTWLQKLSLIRYKEIKPSTYNSSSLLTLFLICSLLLTIYGLFLEINRARSLVWQAFGYIALGINDVDSAIDYMEAAVSIDPKNPYNREALFDAQISKNSLFLKKASGGEDVKNDVDDFIPTVTENTKVLFSLKPYDPSLWFKQAQFYESLILLVPNAEKYAIASVRRAVELDPKNPQRSIDAAKVYITVYERILLVEKNSKGEPAKSIVDFGNDALRNAANFADQAISLKPDYVLAHLIRAEVAVRENNNDKVIDEIKKAETISPKDMTVALEIGAIKYKIKDYVGAEGEFKRALLINPKYSDALYYLALLYHEEGNNALAIQKLEEVLKINPDNKDIQALLEKYKNGDSVSSSTILPGSLNSPETTTNTVSQ